MSTMDLLMSYLRQPSPQGPTAPPGGPRPMGRPMAPKMGMVPMGGATGPRDGSGPNGAALAIGGGSSPVSDGQNQSPFPSGMSMEDLSLMYPDMHVHNFESNHPRKKINGQDYCYNGNQWIPCVELDEKERLSREQNSQREHQGFSKSSSGGSRRRSASSMDNAMLGMMLGGGR